jgi:hypothetical protein
LLAGLEARGLREIYVCILVRQTVVDLDLELSSLRSVYFVQSWRSNGQLDCLFYAQWLLILLSLQFLFWLNVFAVTVFDNSLLRLISRIEAMKNNFNDRKY